MELKPTYNAKGEKRAYYEGEDGNEYFVYHDKKTGYTIRQMNKDDVAPWYDVMVVQTGRRTSLLDRAITMARVRKKIENMIPGESLEKAMIILNPNNKIIGEIDFFEKEPGNAYMQIFLKDEKTVKQKGEKVIEMIQRMEASEFLYDEIWMEHMNGNSIRIA